MIKLILTAWVAWMVFSGLRKIARHIRSTRAFNAKRQAVFFRYEPFLWMRRVV